MRGYIDPEFMPYVVAFIKASGGKVRWEDFKDVAIVFGALEYGEKDVGVIGLCHWGFPGIEPRFIEIDAKYYAKHSKISRFALLFHEMGHCVLNEDHPDLEVNKFIHWLESLGVKTVRSQIENYLPDGCPKTLMHPYDFSEECVMTHFEYYLKELYENGQPNSEFVRVNHFTSVE